MNIAGQKKQLRKKIISWRAAQPPAVLKEKSRLIAQRVLAWPMLKQAQVIFCYVSFDAEVETHSLLKTLIKQGKTVVVPKIIGPGKMQPVLLHNFSNLVTAEYGILAPRETELVKEKIDLNLMPAVAVDLVGHRLGRGSGFYDRFLSNYQPKLNAALVFADQVFDCVPIDEFDKLVNVIITEEALYTVTNPSFA